MTHPIVEARRRRAKNMAKMISPDPTTRLILEDAFFVQLTEHDVEVLRLAEDALPDYWMTSGPMPFSTAWRAGIDALLREVEG